MKLRTNLYVAAALAAAARRLVEERGLRERLSDGATRRAEEYFEIHDMTQRTMDVYETVLDRTFERFIKPRPNLPAREDRIEFATSQIK